MELITLDQSKKNNRFGTIDSISVEINQETHSQKKPRFTNQNDISESEISESFPLKHNMIEPNQSMLVQKFNELDLILNVDDNLRRESIKYVKKSSRIDNQLENIETRESPNNTIYSKKNSGILENKTQNTLLRSSSSEQQIRYTFEHRPRSPSKFIDQEIQIIKDLNENMATIKPQKVSHNENMMLKPVKKDLNGSVHNGSRKPSFYSDLKM